MDLDALLRHYLGPSDPASVDPAAIGPAVDRMMLDFGVEADPGRRFALWALMLVLGRAPDIDTAFKADGERTAARDFARLMARGEEMADPAV